MCGYPNMNNEPELLKIKARDGEFKNLKFQTGKKRSWEYIKESYNW